MNQYEFKCNTCNRRFTVELNHLISDKDVIYCDACYSLDVTKLISKSSFVLKGDGFYRNDNSKKRE